MKKLSPWHLYHIVLYFGCFMLFGLSIIAINILNPYLAISILVVGIISIRILTRNIKCPKCGKFIESSLSIFSLPYWGFKILIPKHCRNCDFNLCDS